MKDILSWADWLWKISKNLFFMKFTIQMAQLCTNYVRTKQWKWDECFVYVINLFTFK